MYAKLAASSCRKLKVMDVQVRLARKSDLASVIELSKGIYDGHDYLSHVFLRWLDEPNRRVIVAEKGGTVIGIRAFHIVDEGKTVVSQSLRVHPKYRGQGVSTVLVITEQKYVQTHFRSVIRERYTTMSTNVRRLAIQRKSYGETLVLELGIIAFHVAAGTVLSWSKFSCAKDQIRSIDTTEFQSLLSGGCLGRIIQKDTLIIDWEPFKAIPSNIACGLLKEDDCLVVSEKNERQKGVSCFSHGRLSPRVKCPHWIATIYAEDSSFIQLHIAKQLEQATLQARKKKFIFSCFLPMYFLHDAKQYVLNEFSLEYVDFFNFNLLLFEKHTKTRTREIYSV